MFLAMYCISPCIPDFSQFRKGVSSSARNVTGRITHSRKPSDFAFNFIASDISALLAVTKKVIYLEDGDVVQVKKDSIQIFDKDKKAITRKTHISDVTLSSMELGPYDHFMQKEIHEQAEAVARTLNERIANGKVLDAAFGPTANEVLDATRGVHIIACGTSYHAGLVARYWIEQLCRIPCMVEIASEYRYRSPVVPDGTLFVTISQSGETADSKAVQLCSTTRGRTVDGAMC